MRDLTNDDKPTYQGSMTELHGPARVLGHHVTGIDEKRYIIALLNDKGNPVQTLGNVRRQSLRIASDG